MHCLCGNHRCLCQDQCGCCSTMCYCTACSSIRGYQDQLCRSCIYARNCGKSGPALNDSCIQQIELYPWQRTGIFPNLDFLSRNSQEPATASDKINENGRLVSQTSSRQRESSPDDYLMFQMDDIDSPSDMKSTNTSPKPVIQDHLQRYPVPTISKPEESRTIEKAVTQDLSGHLQWYPVPKNLPTPEVGLMLDNSPIEFEVTKDELCILNYQMGDSSSSKSSVSSKSPTHPLSTSAPSIFDVPETLSELESLKEKRSTPNTPETSNVLKFENPSDMHHTEVTNHNNRNYRMDDSSKYPLSAKSPIYPLSTSAPTFVPQTFSDLEFSKQKRSSAPNIPETSSNLLEFETLRISGSPMMNKTRIVLESNSLNKNLSMYLPPKTSSSV